jgi:mannosyltransferase
VASVDLRAAASRTGDLDRAPGCVWWLAVVGTTALAAGLGALLIERRPLWIEEAVAVQLAAQPFGDVLHDAVHAEPAQGLYLGLLHPIARLEGAEWTVRTLSVVACTLAALLIYMLGTRLFGRLAGLVAAFALATNAGVVAVSQQARPYALALLGIVASTLLYLRALETNSRARWVLYAVSAAALPFLHPAAVSVLAAHAVASFVRDRHQWSGLAAVVVGLAAGVPVLAASVADRADAPAGAPLRIKEIGEGIARSVGWSPALLLLGLAGIVVLAAGRAPGASAWKAVLVGGLVVTPLAALLLTATGVPARADRVLVLMAPGLALGTGAAVAGLVERWALVAGGALAVAAAATLALHYAAAPVENWRAAVRAVRLVLKPGETVVVAPERARPAFAYYAPDLRTWLRAHGKAAWVVVRAGGPGEAIALGRTVVPTPRYALRRQFRYGNELRLQHWIRP